MLAPATPRHHALTCTKEEYISTCKNNIHAEIYTVSKKKGKKVIATEDNIDDFYQHLVRYDDTVCVYDGYLGPMEDLGYIGSYLQQLQACRNELPSFVLTRTTHPKSYRCKMSPSLNESQNQALASLKRNLELIQGPPGTGKSTIIAHMIRTLKGKTLLTSKNNQAIAAVCLKLKTNMVVLGSLKRVAEECHPFHIDNLVKVRVDKVPKIKAYRFRLKVLKKLKGSRFAKLVIKLFRKKEREKLQTLLQAAISKYTKNFYHHIMHTTKVYLSTIASSWRARTVENIIVDEAGTVEEESMLLLFGRAQKYILVGDHKQLPPFTEVKHFKPVSFFERMVRNGHQVHTLTTQYRMAESIGKMVSKTFYDDKLSHMADNTEDTLVWKKHKGIETTKNMSFFNNGEAQKMKAYLTKYKKKHPSHTIMVITFYNAQRSLLEKELDCKVVSVDGCQGMEADAVFVSCVRSNTHKNIGFCRNKNRLCVAMSRAKKCLAIFGNQQTFHRHRLWRKILKSC